MVKGPVSPHGVGLIISHGKLTVDAGELRQIIGLAYGVQRVLVFGCPAWCDEDKFDIEAKTENVDATRDQIRPMLEALLVERFKLAAHRETKEIPGYILVVGKGGSKLEVAKDASGPTNVFTPYAGGLGFQNMAIVGLVNYLANVLGQPVRDMTALTGRYNFKLEFRPPDPGADPGTPQAIDPFSIVSAAVQDQLGLKLQAGKTPTEVLVIDHADHPTEN
ncbi:conserved hypothetical protein [Candidatus Sulfopaludibacter sp. SbA3]|nr:conserved hypothetical protein [Candidatus Sulfopaludibacter sp. SbA3]